MQNKTLKLSRRSVLAGSAGFILAGGALPRAGRAQTLDRINIATAASNLTTTLQTLLLQQGYLARFGLTTEPMFVVDGTRLMGSIMSGDIDLCPLSGYSQLFPAVAKGANVKLTNASVRLGQQAIFSANPDIRTIKDLKGKTIGVGSIGSQLHQVTLAVLLKNGIDPAEVSFVNIGTSGDVFRAVVAKSVDAGPGQIDNIPNAKKLGVHRLEGGDMWTDLPEYPFQGGYASDRAIGEKRDILVRALAAYATLFRFLSGPDSRDAFFAARRKALSKSGQEFDDASDFQWRFMQEKQPFALDLILPAKGVDFVQDLNVRLGIQKEKLPYDKVADMSLAQGALKLI